jgi:hypothetical protein
MMANCCLQVNMNPRSGRFCYASFQCEDGIDCHFSPHFLREDIQKWDFGSGHLDGLYAAIPETPAGSKI